MRCCGKNAAVVCSAAFSMQLTAGTSVKLTVCCFSHSAWLNTFHCSLIVYISPRIFTFLPSSSVPFPFSLAMSSLPSVFPTSVPTLLLPHHMHLILCFSIASLWMDCSVLTRVGRRPEAPDKETLKRVVGDHEQLKKTKTTYFNYILPSLFMCKISCRPNRINIISLVLTKYTLCNSAYIVHR